jgi:hypothetical protein
VAIRSVERSNPIRTSEFSILVGRSPVGALPPRVVGGTQDGELGGVSFASACRPRNGWPAPVVRAAVLHLLWAPVLRVQCRRVASPDDDSGDSSIGMSSPIVRVGLGTRFTARRTRDHRGLAPRLRRGTRERQRRQNVARPNARASARRSAPASSSVEPADRNATCPSGRTSTAPCGPMP